MQKDTINYWQGFYPFKDTIMQYFLF